MIEQRGWGKFCKHKKSSYAAVVREFYSNLVGRKENSVFVRGVWVPYGAETINAMYGMEGQKHGSKYKKIADRPNREKIARRLTDGKVKWGQGQGEKKIINRGDLTEEANVWFYFLASVLVPTKHVYTVREQEAVILYAILKGYKLNAGAIIENSIVEADSRDEEENARQEEDTLLVEDQEEQDPETQPEGNTSIFAEDMEADERSPIDFTTPLASSPPIRNRDFR